MNDIVNLREEIDFIDDKILKLFLERMSLSEKIARLKLKSSTPIVNKQREDEIIEKISLNSGKYSVYARHLFMSLLNLSKSRQNEIISSHMPISDSIEHGLANASGLIFPRTGRIACQGIEGANSQTACEKLFPQGSITFCNTFGAVFDAVENGLCQFGVLPVENSVNGSVRSVYELLAKRHCNIVRSTKICIHHTLLAANGAELSDIREIYSHEQAIGQCSSFLSTLNNVKIIPCANTAIAAKLVAESGSKSIAAVCSPECAKIYGLTRIKDGIQNSDNNYTRFVCIAKDNAIFDGADKISLMLTCGNKPGALYELISKPAVLGFNMSKLESIPIAGSDFEFMFIAEFDASVREPGAKQMLEQLQRESDFFAFLGCFSEV